MAAAVAGPALGSFEATMANSWRRRDVADWSSEDVKAFLAAALPGHPCTAELSHTSGRVLRTLTKDDLRRRVRDEEAANVLWAELRRAQAAHQAKEDAAAHGDHPYTIFVRTPTDISVELEVRPSDTVADVKERLAVLEGTPVEMQRLTRSGTQMLDERTLASYKVSHGTMLLLVPRLGLGQQRFAAPPSSRSSHVSAAASGIPRPRVPLVCNDITRPFPISIEFPGIPEYQSWMLALQRQAGRRDPAASGPVEQEESAPFLEILPSDRAHEAVQTRVTFEPEAEVLLVDTAGDILMECSRYRVLLHLRQEQKVATLVTGARTAER